MESRDLAVKIAVLLDSKKASSVKVLKVRDLTVLADYFVIASGTSTTHVKSLAEEVEFRMEQEDIRVQRSEGYDSKSWILLDYGNVIVHVFYPESRDYYDLEHLWADAEEVDISAELAAAQEKM